jgi:hypothetical protein
LLHKPSNLVSEAILLFFQSGGPSFEYHSTFSLQLQGLVQVVHTGLGCCFSFLETKRCLSNAAPARNGGDTSPQLAPGNNHVFMLRA